MEPIQGLHHVTAVTRDAQRNVDFYRNVLGQRLVKRTVNFDAPDAYHLYFGDEIGTPGSVLTFFAWPNIKRGVARQRGNCSTGLSRTGRLTGLLAEIISRKGESPHNQSRYVSKKKCFPWRIQMGCRWSWSRPGPPLRFVIGSRDPYHRRMPCSGFHSVTLWLDEIEPTAQLLTEQMGYTFSERTANRHRFSGGPGSLARYVDILHRPRQPEDLPGEAAFGAGSIHHIAFRVPGDQEQLEYQASLRAAGYGVTPVRDRSYFHSIYFREPGGVLFEIATEAPGFAIDESVETLGENLKLPHWYEINREMIQNSLPSLLLKPIS